VGSGQCAVGSGQFIVYSRQWTVDFQVLFGKIRFLHKIFAIFRFKYSLEAKIRFWSKFVSLVKFTDSLRCETSE
jgi:hypothetical protein